MQAGQPAAIQHPLRIVLRKPRVEAAWPTWGLQPDPICFGAPLVNYGTVFCKSTTGVIHAVNASTGKMVWSRQVAPGIGGEMALADHILVIASTDGTLRGIRTATGDEAWQSAVGGAVTESPVIAGDVVYAARADGLHALDLHTGMDRITIPAGIGASSIAVAQGLLAFRANGTLHVWGIPG